MPHHIRIYVIPTLPQNKGWTSENNYIDEIIKETIYNAKLKYHNGFYPLFLEWIPFDKFKDMKQIGEGRFSKIKTHWNLYNLESNSLKFYRITKDSETKEFMLVMQFASQGNYTLF
ncbi:kinase-like domain-containing protein [Rhizophagus irregularis DAOM 181602=DAOM 197198]|nr:kinase-like domain-containing protein [Rhizophagus irregularis DAOM 181602=DAOM 197198]